MSAVFDPVKSANITLTGGNLTATTSVISNWGYSIVNTPVSENEVTGKVYCEFTYTAGRYLYVGIHDNVLPETVNNALCISYQRESGAVVDKNSLVRASYSTFAVGAVIGVAIDNVAKKVWFSVNGVWQGGTPGVSGGVPYSTVVSSADVYPAIKLVYHTSDGPGQSTGRFIGSQFTYDPPEGFFPYDLETWPTLTGIVKKGSTPYSNSKVYLYGVTEEKLIATATPDSDGVVDFGSVYPSYTFILVAHDLSEASEPVAWSITTEGGGENTVTLDFLRSGTPTDQTYTANLVLTAPYATPSGNLLVLRSRPDIDPIDGTIAVTESADHVSAEGQTGLPPDPINGTLSVANKADTASFTGTTRAPARTGTIAITGAADTAVFTGEGYTGIVPRTGTMAVTEAADIATATATYSPKWVATIAATDPGDIGAFDGSFIPYYGPGFIVASERVDTASFSGRIKYDVAGDVAATDLSDSTAFVGRTTEIFDAESTDTLVASDVLTGDAEVVSLVDRVFATDLLDYSRDMWFADVSIASEILSGTLRAELASADTGYATDRLGAEFGSPVIVDTAVATDALTTESIPQSLSDSISAQDALISSSTIAGDLIDTAYARERLDWGVAGESVDVVGIADTLDGTLTLPADFFDLVAITEILDSPITVYAELLSDTGFAEDALAGTLVLVGVLADTVLAGDTLFEAAIQTVYVVNAETGAVSTYAFTPTITGMAEYQGVLYLSGPDGLYALDADQDEDGDVVWTLRTGFSNLGTDLLKRVQDCNFQARTEGDTTFQVVSDRYGQKQEWNYRLPPLTRDSYRDGVVKVGKGVQSVYWQFAAEGVGPAEIDQLRLVVEPLSRRR